MSWPPASDRGAGWREEGVWSRDADHRAANVDRIRAELEAGTYEIGAQEVADAILSFYGRPSDSDESAATPG